MKNVKFRGSNSVEKTQIPRLGSKFRGPRKTVGPSDWLVYMCWVMISYTIRQTCFGFDSLLIVIVIVNSKLLKRHSKAKRRAPAYSRALKWQLKQCMHDGCWLCEGQVHDSCYDLLWR